MGRKLVWSKHYSRDYLGDVDLMRLSFFEHGVLRIALDILWCQTDEPGRYIKHGRIGTLDELVTDCRQYAHKSLRGRSQHAHKALTVCLQAHILLRDEDGAIYSPFIVKQVAASGLAVKGGIARAGKIGHRTGHHAGHLDSEQETDTEQDTDVAVTVQSKSTDRITAQTVLNHLGASTPHTAGDIAKVTLACASKPPDLVRHAISETTAKRDAGEIRSSVIGFFCAVVKKLKPEDIPKPRLSPAEEKTRYNAKRAEALCRDLGLPRAQYIDDACALVGEHDSETVGPIVRATIIDERNSVCRNEPAALWSRLLEHLAGLPIDTETDMEFR